VVVPGANFSFVEADLTTIGSAIREADLLLLQLEIPFDLTQTAAALASQHRGGDPRRVKVILDPAPVQPLPDALYKVVDVITPNETEAAALVGFPIRTVTDAAKAAAVFIERGVQHAVIKMGGKGAFWQPADGAGTHIPALAVNAIDTVAAGDAFNGGLAVALSERKPFEEALRWASATGAISTTKQGAQPSLPHRHEVEALLKG
jgi:ribokinase